MIFLFSTIQEGFFFFWLLIELFAFFSSASVPPSVNRKSKRVENENKAPKLQSVNEFDKSVKHGAEGGHYNEQ